MLKIGKYLLVGLSVATVFLIIFQEKIILHPIKLPQSYKYVFDVPFEEKNIEPKNGIRLNGILFRAKNSKGLVFYNHGNADNLQRWGRHAQDFTRLGYDVFFYDYRGFGKSSGEFSEQEILTDAVFLFDQLKSKYVDKKIIIYGRSLGTGVATFLAKNRKADALILETPYYNMADVGKSWLPFVPFERVLKYEFPTNQWIKDVQAPVVIFHGTNDWVVPYQSGRKLAGVVGSKLITIEGGGHKNLGEFERYHVELGMILK
jgi:uncharacterized protein